MKCYYGWIVDDDILMKSSSGGIFSALAEYTLKCSGIVYGACLDCNTSLVKHIGISRTTDLALIRGSKYQQSEIGNSYGEASSYLKENKTVLFSGTPCQIAGLLGYLNIKRTDTKKLITVEVLCHGVTNSQIIKQYIASAERKYNKTVERYEFRTKRRPWYHSGSSVHLMFNDGKEKYSNHAIDDFYLAYGSGLILRPSCFRCKFAKKDRRLADFTIGDFWGAEEVVKNKEQLKRGISLILTNTEKGEILLDYLKKNNIIYCSELELNNAIPRNGALVKPQRMHPSRDIFLKRIKDHDFNEVVNSIYWKRKIKNHIKMLIGYDNMRLIRKIKSVLRST